MEFQECLSLLAMRPAHAHEHCEEEQHAQDTPQDANASETEENPVIEGETEPEDLRELSPKALVQKFHWLQGMRVQIYADFQQGFQVHQKTEQFPAFCSGVTERFSAVSEQINLVEKLLREEKQQVAIAQLVRNVQLEEKEKLLLTSAVLIEKMRLSDASKQPEPDDASMVFLERSVQTLTTKHTDCVVRINEMLEELYAESADLEDD